MKIKTFFELDLLNIGHAEVVIFLLSIRIAAVEVLDFTV